MAEELDILKIIAESPNISQRKIAEKTGISLGQVNFLIKKCVKKGLIKIEGQTTKSIKYNLTPKGMAEKAARTLQYIKISYGAIVMLTDKIIALAELYRKTGKDIYVYGDEDEMMSVVKLTLGNIKHLAEPVDSAVIFYWDDEKIKQKKEEFTMPDSVWVNILE